MTRPALLWLLFAVAAPAAHAADEPPRVVVGTQTPRRGELPVRIEAYGTAVPAPDGSMTLSVPVEGRVMRIAVAPGARVRKGEPLLEFALSASADAALAQARSALDVARAAQRTSARLFAQQLATADQKAQADKAVADAAGTLAALRAETGGRATQILTAPFDGLVAALPVAQGERIAAGAALATLTRANGLVVTVGVEPREVRALAVGADAAVNALDGGPAVQGAVLRVGQSVNAKTHLVDVDIAAPEGALLGEAFRAQLRSGSRSGWQVPKSALVHADENAAVFQVAAGKAKKIAVQVLAADDASAIVDGDIDAALPLIVEGAYQVDDGADVRAGDEPAQKPAAAEHPA